MTGKPFTASDLAALLAVDPPMSEQRLLAGLQGSRAVPVQDASDVAGLAARVLDNVREEIRPEVAYAVSLATADWRSVAEDARTLLFRHERIFIDQGNAAQAEHCAEVIVALNELLGVATPSHQAEEGR